jgi:putative transcriptional regulator
MKNNIQKILNEKEMTQRELSEKVGVKREYINRIIKGAITPTIPLGIRIAKALGKEMDEVFIMD